MMFITNPKTQPNGFCMRFANGYELSVQWGIGNYCSNKNLNAKINIPKVSSTAEILLRYKGEAVRDGAGVFDTQDGITGWVTADQVADILNKVSLLPEKEDIYA